MHWQRLAFLLFAGGLLFLTVNLHSKAKRFTYRSQIYSDKAGYYAYLPAVFIYGFEDDWPEEYGAEALGKGYKWNERGRLFTKYQAGVAVMQMPFFLLNHYVVSPLLGEEQSGFDPSYHSMVDIAAVFYALMAFLILFRFLRQYFSWRASLITLLAFYLGTNLLYFIVVDNGMSHVYSIFLCALFLRTAQRVHLEGKLRWSTALLLGASAGLLLLVRLTNVFILPAFFLFDFSGNSTLKDRLNLLLRSPLTLAAAGLGIAIFSLQFAYWNHVNGSPFTYSYQNEGFKSWANPPLLKLWFSPRNGMFLYGPLLLLVLAGMGHMLLRRLPNRWLLVALFFGLSYLFASWWDWGFGCYFGSRPFIDYYPFFMIPFGHLVTWVLKTENKALKWGIWSGVGLLVAFTFKNAYLYERCFYGEHFWDWEPFLSLVTRF